MALDWIQYSHLYQYFHPTSTWKISGYLFNPKTAGPRHSISADAASLFPVGGVGTKGV